MLRPTGRPGDLYVAGDLNDEAFVEPQKTLDSNLLGAFLVMKHFAPWSPRG
ncbi:hypothetical protein ABZ568_37500 [Streptomyces olindensis]|uniref:Uncharacterized protein n=1 Tax=Streptomyces olindensis TaxID=358823 RepID=A0ABV2Y705_9ACTN